MMWFRTWGSPGQRPVPISGLVSQSGPSGSGNRRLWLDDLGAGKRPDTQRNARAHAASSDLGRTFGFFVDKLGRCMP